MGFHWDPLKPNCRDAHTIHAVCITANAAPWQLGIQAETQGDHPLFRYDLTNRTTRKNHQKKFTNQVTLFMRTCFKENFSATLSEERQRVI
jgi:hypothetical protein